MAAAKAPTSGFLSPSTLGFLGGLQGQQPSTSTDYSAVNQAYAGRVAAAAAAKATAKAGAGSNFLSSLGSVGGKALDILSRPIYAVGSAVDQASREAHGGDNAAGLSHGGFGDILAAGWHGLEGQSKTDFTNVIQNTADMEKHVADTGTAKGAQAGESQMNPWLKFGGALAADVFLDPTTYVGPGLIKSIVKAPIEAARVAKLAAASKEAADAVNAGVIARAAGDTTAAAAAAKNPIIAAHFASPEARGTATNLDLVGRRPTTLEDAAAGPHQQVIPGSSNIPAKEPVIVPSPKETLPTVTPKGTLPTNIDVTTGLDRNLSRQLAMSAKSTVGKIPVSFPDGVHQALYTVATSRADGTMFPKFMDYLKGHFPGESDTAIMQRANNVKAAAQRAVGESDSTLGKVPVAEVNSAYARHMPVVTAAATDPVAAAQVLSHITKDSNMAKEGLHPTEQAAVDAAVRSGIKSSSMTPGRVFNLNAQRKSLSAALGHIAKVAPLAINKGVGKDRWLQKILPHIEDRMAELGHPATSHTGGALRLSDMIHQVPVPEGTTLLSHADTLIQHVRNETGSGVLHDLIQRSKDAQSVVSNHVDHRIATDMAATIASAPTDVEKAAVLEHALAAAGDDASMKEAIQSAADLVYKAPDTHPAFWKDISENSIKASAENVKASAGILAFMASHFGDKPADLYKSDNALQTFFRAITPSYATRTIHGMVDTDKQAITEQITMMNRIMVPALSKFTPEELQAGAALLKGGISSTDAAPNAIAAAKKMNEFLGVMLGGDGFSAGALKGTTEITKHGLNMDTMNAFMRATAGKDTKWLWNNKNEFAGNQGQWLSSIIHSVPEDKFAEFMVHLNSAVNKAVTEKMFFSGLGLLPGARFSDTAIQGLEQVDHLHGFTNGIWMPPELAQQVRSVIEAQKEFKDFSGKGAEFFDAALHAMKASMTIYNPVHWVHNFSGDAFLSFAAGMTSPKWYGKAGKLGIANHQIIGGFKDAEELTPTMKDLLRPGGYANLGRKTVDPTSNAITLNLARTGKVGQSYRDVAMAMHKFGALPHYGIVEDIPGVKSQAGLLGGHGPFGGRLAKGLQKGSEGREHFERMAFFMYALEHPPRFTKYKSVEDAYMQAARLTQKMHPAGQDLTRFEQKYMRRIFPFYSWTRKVVPALLAAGFERPGRVILPWKINHAAAFAAGVPQPSLSDQYPVDQAFPDWLKITGLGPDRGTPGHYGFNNLSLPGTSEVGALANPKQFLLSALNPMLKVPASLISNTNLDTGQPFKNPAQMGQYLNSNTPISSTVGRLTNTSVGPGTLFGTPTQTPTQSKGQDTNTGLLNWLLGLGAMDSGKYIPKGQPGYIAPTVKLK